MKASALVEAITQRFCHLLFLIITILSENCLYYGIEMNMLVYCGLIPCGVLIIACIVGMF